MMCLTSSCAHPSPRSTSAAREARYRLLEPVRQYARERLDNGGDTADRHRRHLQHYLNKATTLTTDIDGLGETKFDELRPELSNFRAALDWAACETEATDAGLALATRLQELWTSETYHQEGLSRIVGLLASGDGSPALRSQAAYRACFIASQMGDDGATLALAQQALAEAQAGSDRLGEIRARRVISSCLYNHRGDVARARQHIEEAIELATDEASDLLLAKCMLQLADIALYTGSLDEASDRIQQVLDGPAGSIPAIEMNARSLLSDIMYFRGSYAAARTATTKALALAESANSLTMIVSAHLDLASIECAAGRFEDCAAHIAIAEELNPETAHSLESNFLIARAALALARGDDVEALQLAEKARALEDESWSAGVQGVSNARYLGDAQLGVDNANDALNTYQQLIVKATAGHYAWLLAEGHEGSAAAELALGNHQDAHQHLAAAKEIRERIRSQRLPRPAVDRWLAALETETPT